MNKAAEAKDARRKNLHFKPEGKSPIHDAAVSVLNQLGRGGANDFVAAAVVYFSYCQSQGIIPNDFFEAFGGGSFRPTKVVFVGGPPGTTHTPSPPVKPTLYDRKEEIERGDDGAQIKTPDRSGKRSVEGDVSPLPSAEEITPDTDDGFIIGTAESSLPMDLMKKLVHNF
ncbi:MAG: hypothetical protein FWE32_02105 [Oscillospiraceae bacterium]|nr:hypothetical protein [Oscillospiraceae bacterium]